MNSLKSPTETPSVRRFKSRSELSRARDVARQSAAWQSTCDLDNLQRVDLPNDKHNAVTCPDKALAAFAQLVTLRLGTRTALISLVGGADEYILAELSRTTPFQRDLSEKLHEPLNLGVCRIAREDGFAWKSSQEWQKARQQRTMPHDREHYYIQGLSQHSLIISDMRHDSKYKNIPLVKQMPWMRFVCAVPLRGVYGSVIGQLAVFDDKPRYGVSCDDMSFLEDIADTIVEHLDSMIVRSQRQLSDRYLQALTLFNTGYSTLRHWWAGQDDARVMGQGRRVPKDSQLRRQDRIDKEFGMQSNAKLDSHTQAPGSYFTPQDHLAAQRSAPLSPPTNQVFQPVTSARETLDPKKSIDEQCGELYDRASNLLREALRTTGVVFVDAKHATEHRDASANHSDSEDSHSFSSGDDSSIDCSIKGLSTYFNDASSAEQPFALSKSSLKRIIKKYPRGGVVHFDADGLVQSSSDDEPARDDPKLESKTKSLQALTSCVSNPRSMLFLPIRNQHEKAWQSCVFAWSSSEGRIFDGAHDLLYLTTFCQSLSVELSRADNLALDRAKDTFLSSISHELRSPLHGILAGADFIQESELTAFQAEMVHSIQTAGRILLDTIDHVLDHSKISAYARETRVRTPGALAKHLYDVPQATTTIDLALLTEEIVETTLAAHRSQSKRSVQSPSSPSSQYGFSTNDEVTVALNVNPYSTWHVRVESGAWVRILTNLIGNSLKYTSSGTIAIRLVASRTKDNKLAIELEVADTGCGMSEAFLADGMYEPFKQEDPMVAGTGLGLSIVKRLVEAMAGEMSVKSQKNVGTTTRISLTVDIESGDKTPADFDDVVVDHFQVIEKNVDLPDADANPTKIAESVLQTADTWLRCKTICSGTLVKHNETGRAVCAITDKTLARICKQSADDGQDLLSDIAEHYSHVLVLASSKSTLSLDSSIAQLPLQHVFLHQPIGPRKLLRAITSDRGSTLLGGDQKTDDELPTRPKRLSRKVKSSDVSAGKLQEIAEERPRQLFRNQTSTTSTKSSSRSPSTPHTSMSGYDKDDTVLLVEDNEINMKLLIALMNKLRTPYHAAVNGQEAVQLYKKFGKRYCLVLMDMSMPVMDGFTATAEIRKLESKRAMPRTNITALTGVTSQDSKVRAFSCGVDGFYSKPVKMKEIEILLEQIRAKLCDDDD